MDEAPFFVEIAEGPMGGAAYWLETDDGVRIRAGLWRASGQIKGTVFLFPGRTEYIELQGRNARDFVNGGFSVFTLDWRGHGLSNRLTSDPNVIHVRSFLDYQRDVEAMANAATDLDLPRPWYLLGNSMGGCIGLRALAQGLPIAACAFTAPMWDVKMSAMQRMIALPVTWAASTFGKDTAYVPGHDEKNYVLNNPFHGNRITFDADGYGYWVRQASVKPSLQTAGSSMRWLYEGLLECRRLRRQASFTVPCIAFCGDHDETVEIDAIAKCLASWPNGSFLRVGGAKHGLLLESREVRNKVIAKIVELFSGPVS